MFSTKEDRRALRKFCKDIDDRIKNTKQNKVTHQRYSRLLKIFYCATIIKKLYCFIALLVKKLNPDYFARLDRWDFFGNAILNKYIAKASENEFHSIDHKQNNIIMEVAYWDEQKQEFSPNEQYVKYYFENDFSEYFLQKEQGLVMLHNSWTPAKYKSMGEDEFLQQNITMARVLKKLL